MAACGGEREARGAAMAARLLAVKRERGPRAKAATAQGRRGGARLQPLHAQASATTRRGAAARAARAAWGGRRPYSGVADGWAPPFGDLAAWVLRDSEREGEGAARPLLGWQRGLGRLHGLGWRG